MCVWYIQFDVCWSKPPSDHSLNPTPRGFYMRPHICMCLHIFVHASTDMSLHIILALPSLNPYVFQHVSAYVSMYMYVFTYIYLSTYIYVSTYISIFVHASTDMRLHILSHYTYCRTTYTVALLRLCACLLTCVCICVHVYVCVYIHILVYIYLRVYIDFYMRLPMCVYV